MKFTRTMHTDAAPEVVTSYLIDAEAMPPSFDMKAVYEAPEVVGSSYEWTGKMLGITRKGVSIYTEYIPGERVAFRNFGAMEGDSSWTVEPDNGGSKVTAEIDAGLNLPVIGRLFERMMLRQFEKNLEYGKREIEKRAKLAKAAS